MDRNVLVLSVAVYDQSACSNACEKDQCCFPYDVTVAFLSVPNSYDYMQEIFFKSVGKYVNTATDMDNLWC